MGVNSLRDGERRLVPHPETQVNWDNETGALWVEAPWMRTHISGLPAALRNQKGDSDALLSEIAKWPQLRRLPYWFHVPRNPNDSASEMDLSVGARGPDTGLHFEAGVAELISRARACGFAGWEWPLDELVSRAGCVHEGGSLDAVSAYSLLQREVLRGEVHLAPLGNRVKEFFTKKGASESCVDIPNEDMKKELLVRLVQVSLRVTRAAPEVLAPACLLPGRAGRLVREFVEGERGHDSFASRSLSLMGRGEGASSLSHEELELPTLDVLLETLGMCASESPLGLALSLFAFERLSFDTPVWSPWSELSDSDARHALEGVGKHAEINELGRHSDIGLELAEALGRVSFAHALVGARLAEVCVQLRLKVLKDLYATCAGGIRDPQG